MFGTTPSPLSRRALLRMAGASGLAAVAAACAPSAPAPEAPAVPTSAAAPTPFKPNVEAAKAEGKGGGYGSMITSQETNLREILQAQSGLPFEFVRIPTRNQLITRVETEQNAGVRIVDFIDQETGTIDYLVKEGLIQKMPPAILQRVPEAWRDPNGYWVAWFKTPVGFIYNTQLVPAAEAPKTMDDLLNPKWKGKIALTNPILNSTFGSWFYFWQKQLGQEKADAFFKGLAAQNPTLFESGLTVSTNVNQGQFSIGLGFLTHVLSVGGPGGRMNFMKLDPQPGIVSGIAMLKTQPHPNAAVVLADTMIGSTFLTRAASIGYLVPLPGIKSAIPGLDDLNVKILPEIPNQEADRFGTYLKSVFAK